MILMTDDVVLDVYELDDDVKVRLQVGRFECVPEARHSHGFIVAVTRVFTDEPSSIDETSVFEVNDVSSVPLDVSQELRAKLERMLLQACFGVFAHASYRYFNPDADLDFPILMAIAYTNNGFSLMLGDQVSVPFKTMEDLQAMLPSFSAEGELGYEEARAALIARFVDAANDCATESRADDQ